MKFQEVIEKKGERLYVCDLCKEVFPVKDLQLTEPTDGVTLVAMGSKFLFVNGEGELVASDTQPRSADGDLVLTCPLCGAQHPFGFVKARDPKVVKEMGHD